MTKSKHKAILILRILLHDYSSRSTTITVLQCRDNESPTGEFPEILGILCSGAREPMRENHDREGVAAGDNLGCVAWGLK